MFSKKYLIFLICFLSLFWFLSAKGQATGTVTTTQEGVTTTETTTSSQVIPEVEQDEEVSSQELGVKEPKILPDSPFYFLKKWQRELRAFFTFNPVKKAELRLRFASEKLLEAKKLAEKTKNPEILEKAVKNYEDEIEKIKKRVDKIKEKASENQRVDRFLDKFVHQQMLHEKILEKLENKLPPQVIERIKKARERHLQRFAQVMQRLENKEKIKERLERNLKALPGSRFKEFTQLGILKNLENASPEEIREEIMKAREAQIERLKQKLENLPVKDQEKLREYIERIKMSQERKLEILEDLKERVEQNPQLQNRLDTLRNRVLLRIQEHQKRTNCPAIEPPAVGACRLGRMVPVKDEKGCIVKFECVKPADINLRKKIILPLRQKTERTATTATGTSGVKRQKMCVTLWNPVCGQDGRTYTNACWAKVAGVEIAHRGICQSQKPFIPDKVKKRLQRKEGGR